MDPNVILTTGGSLFIASYFIQLLKKASWFPILGVTADYQAINRVFSILVAGAASFGVHYTFDKTAGTLLISGLNPMAIAHGLYLWVIQYALQHGVYKTVIVPVEMLAQNTKLQSEILSIVEQIKPKV